MCDTQTQEHTNAGNTGAQAHGARGRQGTLPRGQTGTLDTRAYAKPREQRGHTTGAREHGHTGEHGHGAHEAHVTANARETQACIAGRCFLVRAGIVIRLGSDVAGSMVLFFSRA